MDIREQILDKYKEFQSFLESIDTQELRGQFTRQELNEFKKALYDINLRSLAYEISKITEEMKNEEFPQLLAVHRFPIINTIEFLTEKEKIELDKYLVMHRVGNYVSGLWKITRNETKRKQLEQWLLDNGVVEDVYAIICPRCGQGHISSTMTRDQKEEFELYFKRFKETGDYDDYEVANKYMEYICMECDEETEMEDIKEFRYKDMYKMKMKRDTTLDNA